MFKKLLVKARDAQWLWDMFGPIYNRQIYNAIFELYEHISLNIDVDTDSQILDVGTGRGYMALQLASHIPMTSVVGIDFSPTQIRAAERLRKKRRVGNCRYQLGNAMEIPFREDHFDAIVSVGSIKHWPDPQKGVSEMRRVLAPGGWAVISETDKEVSDEALRQFMARFKAWYLWNPLLFWGLRHIIFGESYSHQEIVAFFKAAGFKNIHMRNLGTCPYVIVKAQK